MIALRTLVDSSARSVRTAHRSLVRAASRAVVALALAWLFVVGGLGSPTEVRAQERPVDMPLVSSDVALPAAPEGFVRVDRGNVRWEMPELARPLVEPLFDTWDRALPRIQRELGITGPMPPILVRIGVDPAQMEALAPEGAPPPPYAVGVAYPGLSLILLTLTAPETWQRPELHEVLVHELSHVALEQALRGEHGEVANHAPLWLVEGVAIYQARERSIERVQTLWEAAFRGGVIDLDDLDERFPSRPHAVGLAYAESADFVAWLLRRSGPDKLGEMLGRMRRGQRFETAVSQTWSLGIGSLELEWREDLSERFGALPMFATGSAGWVLVGVLVVLAWRRRKERVSAIEQRWAEEDAREEQQARAWARHRARVLARERALRLAQEGISSGDLSSRPREIVVTTEAREKPTTVFVVGTLAPEHTAETSGTSETPAQSDASVATRDAAPFDADLERGERPLH